jgi:hypothetical protein
MIGAQTFELAVKYDETTLRAATRFLYQEMQFAGTGRKVDQLAQRCHCWGRLVSQWWLRLNALANVSAGGFASLLPDLPAPFYASSRVDRALGDAQVVAPDNAFAIYNPAAKCVLGRRPT